jgi:hypothetical protein
MAEKQNKNLIIGIAVAAVVVIAVIIGIVLMKGKGDDVIEAGDGEQSGQVEEGVKDMDFSEIDVSVEYGDYDSMFTQSKAIQNGEMLGKVIKIDGVVSHPMSSYSIGQEDENGSFVGTVFVIEGIDDDEYPEDGDRVVITGEVVEQSPMNFVIRTLPQYIEIEESTEALDDEEPASSDEVDEFYLDEEE